MEAFGLRPDGHTVVAWGSTGSVRVVDLLSGAEQAHVKAPAEVGWQFNVSADGKDLGALWKDDGANLRLWDVDKGQEIRKLSGFQGGVLSVAFSADNKLVATISADGTTRVWKITTGKEAFKLASNAGPGSCAFSPDGKLLAVLFGEGDLCLIETLTGTERCRLRLGRSGSLNVVAFSPDSRLLALSCGDEVIRLCDVVQGKALRGLVGHQDAVSALAFAPGGKVLGSGDDGGTIRLWKIDSGEEVRTSKGMRER